MAKTITLKIELDGSQQVLGQIEDIGNGLHDIDSRDAKSLHESLQSIDGIRFGNLKSQVSDLKLAFTEFLGNIAAQAVAALTSKLYEGAKALLNYKSALEQTEIGFTSLLGNGGKARQLLKEIQTFAKETPFEFQGIAQLSQRLAGANVEAKKIIPLMRDIGNIVAATGEASQERLEGVVVAITQMISKQKVSAEEMEQLAERGINGFDLLSKATGKSQAELRKMAEQGQISSDVMVAALQKVSREKFGDAMEKQSKTFLGSLSNIKDSLFILASNAFQPLYEKISKIAYEFSQRIDAQKGDFKKIGNVIAEAIGEGLGLGLQVIIEKIVGYIAVRLKEIFTEGKIFDSMFASIVEGIGAGILKGFGAAEPIIERYRKTIRAMFLQKDSINPIEVLRPVYDYSRPQDYKKDTQQFDFSKITQDSEKLKKERQAAAQAELSAQISLYQNQISEVEKIYKDSFDKISEIFKETNNPAQFQASFDQLKAWYGEQINSLVPAWEDLTRKQTLSEKQGQFERLQVYQDVQKRKQELTDATFKLEDNAAKLLKENSVKASKETIQNAEDVVRRKTEIADTYTQTQIKNIQYLAKTGAISEKQSIEEINRLNLQLLEAKRHTYEELLKMVKGNADKEKEYQQQITLIDYEISQQKIDNAQRVYDFKSKQADKQLEEDKKRAEEAKKILDDYTYFKGDLNSQLEEAQRNGREMSEYERTLRKINKDYADLDEAKKIDLLNTAKQIDAQREFNKIYNETYNLIRDSLDILTDKDLSFGEKIKSIFGNIGDRLKENFLDKLAGGLTDAIFGVDFSKSKNPVVGEIQTSNTYLKQIAEALTGKTTVGGISVPSLGRAGGGGFNLGNLLNEILHGGSSQGGVYGTFGGGMDQHGIFSFNGSGGSGLGIGGGAGASVGASGGGSIWSNLKTLFSTQPGGIFARRGGDGTPGSGSRMAGILGGIGDIATMIAPLLGGGRLSNIVGMAGQGASIGAMFGPWGAAIGAAAGGLIGLFMGDPKRKEDKKQNIPALHKGFADAIAQMRELVEQTRKVNLGNALSFNPDDITKQAAELRSQISSGFGIEFKSKKYRKVAQNEIAAKLREFDTLNAELETLLAAARLKREQAQIADERERRLLPEFASGVYMDAGFRNQYSDFKRYNGMMPGSWTGRDYIRALIADEEMVLNRRQRLAVIRAAGFDPFEHAGIPNYKPGGNPLPRYAEGVSFASPVSVAPNAPTINFSPKITIVMEGDGIDDVRIQQVAIDGLDTPQGRVEVVKAYEKGKARKIKY